MKEETKSTKSYLWILLGAILTLLPAVYWRFMESENSLYADVKFFPHYFVMLVIAVLVAAVNCFLNKKYLQDQSHYYMQECISGAVILWTYATIMVLVTCYKQGDFDIWFIIVLFCGAVILVYEAIQLLLHTILHKIVNKIVKK